MPSSKPNRQPGIPDPRPPSEPNYLVRIYRSNGAYHVVLLSWELKVADLITALGQKLFLSKEDVAAHRLFIQERGAERVLLPTERPAGIVQRRLREAGYDDGDFKKLLSGKDTSFVFKFIFKSYLASNGADLTFVEPGSCVHLTHRNLRSIPKSIRDHAQEIVSLTLGNSIISAVTPHFLGSCTKLNMLHWSNSAIHRVPRSLSHAFSIRHLDLSSNRIEDLRDMYLDSVPVQILLLQNNCISEIPSHFSRITSLLKLNLSNNNLKSFPDAILSLPISDLDLSFNEIQSIKLEGESLPYLKQLLVNGNGLQELGYSRQTISHLDIRQNQLAHSYFDGVKNLHAAHSTSTTRPMTLSVASENETVDLSHNHLRLCDCGRVCSCRSSRQGYRETMNITSLDISHAMLSRVPASLYRFQGLRILHLDHNSLQELPSDGIQELIYLEVLSCSYNCLTTFPSIGASNSKLRVLWEIPLTTLNLTSNRITAWPNKSPEFASSGSSGLGGSLEALFLAGNLLTGDALEPLQDLVKLNTLHLSFNEIAFFPHKFITGFRWLEDARLAGNPLPQSPEDLQVRILETSHAYISNTKHTQEVFEVAHRISQGENTSVFAIFQPILSVDDPTRSRLLAGHVRDRFVDTLVPYLNASTRIPDALRLTFLDLNHQIHTRFARSDDADALRAGVSALAACVVDMTLYVANVGRDLAVISTNGKATLLSNIHDPVDDAERTRIRRGGGWISPNGLVNDELGVSRAFGFFHLFPAITPRPNIREWDLTEFDEFLIVASQQFWECVTYQVAVDIVQDEIDDLEMATQKLLEMALGFGAKDGPIEIGPEEVSPLELPKELPVPVELSSGGEMISQGELGRPNSIDESPLRSQLLVSISTPPPTGYVAIVFTDIRNPTPFQTTLNASRAYRMLLRRELCKCKGYEVSVADNAFFCIFQNTLAAIWWSLSVQLELTNVRWGEGDSAVPQQAAAVPYVLPVSMGVHCGPVVSEPDPITHRMDYLGLTVSRAARISAVATQGQIMCSADIMRAIHAVVLGFEDVPPEFSAEPDEAVAAIRGTGVVITPVGERRLVGLEVPESLSIISPVFP
ncbi:hypothetical protein BD779DRAFT_1799360 [Infundibulicybe gibba]|nr:hypothetical protein BD779DRAFT_1799360 [Infundibulicybe gibba]